MDLRDYWFYLRCVFVCVCPGHITHYNIDSHETSHGDSSTSCLVRVTKIEHRSKVKFNVKVTQIMKTTV